MNAPDRFELFLLQDGERKIKEEIYPSMANTSQFTIIKEDHTVANLLVSYLRKHPNVRFAAYKSKIGRQKQYLHLFPSIYPAVLTPIYPKFLTQMCRSFLSAFRPMVP